MKDSGVNICDEYPLEWQKAECKEVLQKVSMHQLTPFKNTSRRTPENRLLGIKICTTKSNLSTRKLPGCKMD